MRLRDLFAHRRGEKKEVWQDQSINQAFYYLYVIIALQIFVVFGLLGGIMFIGKILATPLWVFVVTGLGVIWCCIYIYRKIKLQFQKLYQALARTDLSNKNYQITIMGGVLSMRVEQNSRPLLEAPPSPPPSPPIVDAEVIKQ
ncbi:MAG: hypothetical protein AB2L11_02435 [Syntrophobacteraceae bacterium]